MFATCLLLRQEAEEAKVVDCLRIANQAFAIGVGWLGGGAAFEYRKDRRVD